MAPARSSPARKRRRPSRNGLSHEYWLLILGTAVLVAVTCGSITRLPWPFGSPSKPSPRTLTMAQARASNALVPIVARDRKAADRFVFHGGEAAREQAVECLATVALYEAGTDSEGQRAVIQVVLNRVRARGFPKTVCGVVYQGSGRTTGCQFSFTCDGSLQRRPEHEGWDQARRAARRALAGHVYAAVGRATHYHTDWMVPYWRPSLEKIGQVNSHIFYQRH